MKFLLDNNLPPRAAVALDAIYGPEGHRIHHIRKVFDDPAIQDEEWIRRLGEDEDGWAVVTRDKRIRWVRQEREAWFQANVTVFFLKPAWAKVPTTEMCTRLVNRWPEILKIAQHRRRARGYSVPLKGKIEPLKA